MSGWEILKQVGGPWIVYWTFGGQRVQEFVAWSRESAEEYVNKSNREGLEIYVTESMA
jgi:hypothetical protein